jgi:protease-4
LASDRPDVTRRRLLAALGITGLAFLACFIVIAGLLVMAGRDGLLGGNRVALVEVDGIIIDAERVVRELEEHLEDPAIRAVVVRIQSPGGVVAPTQEIHDAILRVRAKGKPVVASMGAVAASGGYYLAAASDKILANPGTLTGSIGVVMQLAEIEGLLSKAGVHLEVVKAGRHKDIGSVARRITPEEREILQALLDDMYDQFVSAVARGRGLERAAVLQLADGRVYSGRRAKELGLVDELGGLEDAVRVAGDLAGLTGKPRLVRPRRPFHLSDVFEWLGGRSGLSALWPAPAGLAGLLPGAPKVPLYLME